MPPETKPPCGVLVLDKPRGPTSHDLVGRLRRALGTRRVGHGGTLDPMATGVMVMLVGEATKLASYLTAQGKRYEARVVLGRATTTLDADGETTSEAQVPGAILDAIARSDASAFEAALSIERARREQIPPAHSAIHVDGRRSYELARAGEAVELAPRPVEVETLRVMGCGFLEEAAGGPGAAWIDVEICVSKGYYVRSLARDLGEALGTVAHLGALRRTQSGRFEASGATACDASPDALREALIPLETAAGLAMPVATLIDEGAARARVGKRLDATHFVVAPESAIAAWLDPSGKLVAVGEREGDEFVVRRGFTSDA